MKERGIAIVSVLIVVAIVSVIASSIVIDQQYAIRRTTNMIHGNQLFLHMLSLEAYAIEVLREDTIDHPSVDHKGEDWAVGLPPVAADGGMVSGKIEDLQGRFNLNTLYLDGKRNARAFVQLRCLLKKTVNDVDHNYLAASVVNWMAGKKINSQGADNLDYLSKDPSYRMSGRPLTSPSELLLIDGFTYKIYENIKAYITALPVKLVTSGQGNNQVKNANYLINLNTAPSLVLRCLNGDDDPPITDDLMAYIEELKANHDDNIVSNINAVHNEIQNLLQPYISEQQEQIRNGQLPQNTPRIEYKKTDWPITVKSQFFQFKTMASFGDMKQRMAHVIHRNPGNPTRVLMRVYGDEW